MGSKNDQRITKVGRFIRRTRSMNFLKSLILEVRCPFIGPRPERPEFITRFLKKDIPNFNNRLAVRPGIRGWRSPNR